MLIFFKHRSLSMLIIFMLIMLIKTFKTCCFDIMFKLIITFEKSIKFIFFVKNNGIQVRGFGFVKKVPSPSIIFFRKKIQLFL